MVSCIHTINNGCQAKSSMEWKLAEMNEKYQPKQYKVLSLYNRPLFIRRLCIVMYGEVMRNKTEMGQNDDQSLMPHTCIVVSINMNCCSIEEQWTFSASIWNESKETMHFILIAHHYVIYRIWCRFHCYSGRWHRIYIYIYSYRIMSVQWNIHTTAVWANFSILQAFVCRGKQQQQGNATTYSFYKSFIIRNGSDHGSCNPSAQFRNTRWM